MAALVGVRDGIRDVKTRQAIAQMSKEDLEDKHYRLMEENMALKKYSRSQEEKMKKMATKLLKLTSDEKREAKREGQWFDGVNHGSLEAELDDALARNRELEKQNTALKSKNMVLKQQLDSHGRRHTPYDRVQPRISSGIKRRSQRSISTEELSSKRPAAQDAGTQAAVSCHNLLEEIRRDNQELEDQLLQLQQEMSVLRAERERSREQQRLKAVKFEQEKLQLQEEHQSQLNALQKELTESEVSVMKAQRETRDRGARLDTLQSRHDTLERNNTLLKGTHAELLTEMEQLSRQLKEERVRSSKLQGQAHDARLSSHTITELRQDLEELTAERDRLKSTNERLKRRQEEFVSSREQQLDSQLKPLQQKLREQEHEHKKELKEKAKVIDQLSVERALSEKLDSELKEHRATYLSLKQEYDQMKHKLAPKNKDGPINWTEIGEALALVRGDKPAGPDHQELQSKLTDTANELGKIKQLLQIQQNLNKEYKKEVESLKAGMEEREQENSSQLKGYTKLLDVKSARIKQLEGKLKDIAYGTRQVKLVTEKVEQDSSSDVQLERGQNLLQFHASKVSLSSQALSLLRPSPQGLFLTISYSDYEVQVTPVCQGTSPQFDFTSNFVVAVDDLFLSSLQKDCVVVEVNQAIGSKYHPLAAATVSCKEFLSNSGRVSIEAPLSPRGALLGCSTPGVLSCWLGLKLPIDKTLRLHQDKVEALSVVDGPSVPAQPLPSASIDPSYNELLVTVSRCHGLATKDSPPSCYVMYKFYTFPDQDTPIIADSRTPVFNHTQSFPVSIDQHLTHYLKSKVLEVFLFDDHSDETYLGIAKIGLADLAEGQPLTGTHQFLNANDEPCGYLDISLKWRHPYHTAGTLAPPSTTPNSSLEELNKTYDKTEKLQDKTLELKGRSVEGKVDPPQNPPASDAVTKNVGPKKMSNQKVPPKPQAVNKSKPLPKAAAGSARLVPELKNSLPPLKSAPGTVAKEEGKPLGQTPVRPIDEGKPLVNAHIKEQNSDSDFTLTDTASVVSSLDEPPRRDPLPRSHDSPNKSPDVSAVSSRVSLTPNDDTLSHTEISEEIEEDFSEGDTMFDDPLHQSGSGDVLSELSEHSSDKIPLSKPLPVQPQSHDQSHDEDEDDWSDVTPSDLQDGNPITTSNSLTVVSGSDSSLSTISMSIAVESFTAEADTSLGINYSCNLFVEYQFLNFDPGELETPSSLPKPGPGETIVFNFKKVFELSGEQLDMLADMLRPGDPSGGRVVFTVVADPEDQEADCEELGTAEIDLNTILQKNLDIESLCVDVVSFDSGDNIGFLTLSVEALDTLKKLNTKT